MLEEPHSSAILGAADITEKVVQRRTVVAAVARIGSRKEGPGGLLLQLSQCASHCSLDALLPDKLALYASTRSAQSITSIQSWFRALNQQFE